MTDALQQAIHYRFQKADLLTLALTHPSMQGGKSNQRLEFLGDAVLGLLIARMLYDQYPNEKEGELARRQAALVRGETLTKVAQAIGLGEALRIGASEHQAQGRKNASNLEDALEALIGALYLDGGIETADAFVQQHWFSISQETETPPKDAKTALQEWAQARSLPVPSYDLVKTSGPAHAPLFTVAVTIQGYDPKQAKATSKRLAEQLAASLLLEALPHE